MLVEMSNSNSNVLKCVFDSFWLNVWPFMLGLRSWCYINWCIYFGFKVILALYDMETDTAQLQWINVSDCVYFLTWITFWLQVEIWHAPGHQPPHCDCYWQREECGKTLKNVISLTKWSLARIQPASHFVKTALEILSLQLHLCCNLNNGFWQVKVYSCLPKLKGCLWQRFRGKKQNRPNKQTKRKYYHDWKAIIAQYLGATNSISKVCISKEKRTIFKIYCSNLQRLEKKIKFYFILHWLIWKITPYLYSFCINHTTTITRYHGCKWCT